MTEKIESENIDLAKIYKSNDFDALKNASLKILKKKPGHIDALNALAVSYKELGDINNAEKTFLKLINEEVKVDYVFSNAGNFFYNIGKIDIAQKLQEHALKLNPKNVNAFNQIGMCHSNRGQDDEAIKYYKDAIKIDPNYKKTNKNIANSYRNLQNFKEAVKFYDKSDEILDKCQQLECYYMMGDYENFYKKLNILSENYPPHPLAASLSKHASIRFDQEDNYSFCSNPFDFIYKSDLFNKGNLSKQLLEEFFQVINSKSLNVRGQSLLNNGKQSSGNIFLLNDEPVQKIKKIIIDELENYKKKFSEKKQGIINNWPQNYKIMGWLIIMEKGGNLSAHMHKEGWVSGSIYLERPKRVDEFDGDLLFSFHGSNYPKDDKEFDSKLVQIEKGDMVLFPSSLFHGTFPYSSDEKRITLAFDIMPVY